MIVDTRSSERNSTAAGSKHFLFSTVFGMIILGVGYGPPTSDKIWVKFVYATRSQYRVNVSDLFWAFLERLVRWNGQGKTKTCRQHPRNARNPTYKDSIWIYMAVWFLPRPRRCFCVVLLPPDHQLARLASGVNPWRRAEPHHRSGSDPKLGSASCGDASDVGARPKDWDGNTWHEWYILYVFIYYCYWFIYLDIYLNIYIYILYVICGLTDIFHVPHYLGWLVD